MEVPLTLATVGVIAAPALAGLGAIAALIANFTLGVERVKEDTAEAGPEDAPPPAAPEVRGDAQGAVGHRATQGARPEGVVSQAHEFRV